jgi:hypothetical protein
LQLPGPEIHIEDVQKFYHLYDQTDGHPTAEQLQRDYLDSGSDGLHQFARLRHVTGARIADNIAKRPEMYSNARRCMSVLPGARKRLAVALAKLGRIDREAKFPPVTVVIGPGKPVGIGSPVTGVQIGLEALCATTWLTPKLEDRVVDSISHEYVHVEQVRALVDDEHPTVLEGSLIEGAADFIGEMISGGLLYTQFAQMTKGREKEIETAFAADEEKKDLSKWLYNSTLEKPGDLGYWVGYRIVKSYYQHSTDKRRALREIIHMADPRAFLAKSGWYPGIELN